ncbi:MAG: precorrin-6y C5,15-methyltransferase (decarboxylating) subunit CbiE [Desulfobacteraceae bacterium]|nr:precorrin-6y C5,15-methyltransferase (decarboxylating) subunit CbiE [Desulfobacteraceae bacterium]
MNLVSVIGLGMSYQDLTDQHLTIIRESDVLMGGVRHLSLFPDFTGEKIEISKNLEEIVNFILKHQASKKMTVLASGDPLFYGIGGYLSKKIGRDNIIIYPNVSTIAAAFARLGEPWQDAELISLHGRQMTPVHLERIRNCQKAAVLTDNTRTPVWLQSRLKEAGIEGFRICVLEQIGDKDETLTWISDDDTSILNFKNPNIVLLLKEEKDTKTSQLKTEINIGMPEALFHHEKGLITKSEVRAVSLSKLKLMTDHVLWDLGAGSGSISIEAHSFIKTGQIFAVEKDQKRIKDIKKNKDKFNVDILKIIHSELPAGIEQLPAPDRVFIGGGGKNLSELVECSASYMKKGGVIVVNTVLLANVTAVLEKMDQLHFNTDIVQIQVSRGHHMPWNLMLKSQNPVFIISGEKR